MAVTARIAWALHQLCWIRCTYLGAAVRSDLGIGARPIHPRHVCLLGIADRPGGVGEGAAAGAGGPQGCGRRRRGCPCEEGAAGRQPAQGGGRWRCSRGRSSGPSQGPIPSDAPTGGRSEKGAYGRVVPWRGGQRVCTCGEWARGSPPCLRRRRRRRWSRGPC